RALLHFDQSRGPVAMRSCVHCCCRSEDCTVSRPLPMKTIAIHWTAARRSALLLRPLLRSDEIAAALKADLARFCCRCELRHRALRSRYCERDCSPQPLRAALRVSLED
ncbi:hypothetical protein Dimus_022330, partial [Dionaea muscipula]